MKEKWKMGHKSINDLFHAKAVSYAKAKNRHEKSVIINDIVEDTGYNRKYVIAKLSGMIHVHTGINLGGSKVKYRKVVKRTRKRDGRGRPRAYDEKFITVLEKLWEMFDRMCPSRLLKLVRDNMDELRESRTLGITNTIASQLETVSTATAGRLLAPARDRLKLSGRSGTRSPGSALNSMIPVRVFYSMEERLHCGIFEIDTVCHCGYGEQGTCLWTLTLTDVATGYMYIRALSQKTQRYILAALADIWESHLYPIRELHMDNGSEFKNMGFLAWCDEHHVSYSRSRSYHKNDNCHVEQKNFSIVRECVGYFRYEADALDDMEDLYWHWERLVNFFYPSFKIISKERVGSYTRKIYDAPRSPCERLLGDDSLSAQDKAKLMDEHDSFGLLALKKSQRQCQEQLLQHACKELKKHNDN